MAVNFKLGPVRAIDPADDDMGRSWVGYSPTHSPQATFDHNRGIWGLGARAARERYATYSYRGTVVVVVEIDHIEVVPRREPSKRRVSAIAGRVLEPGEEAYEALIGQPVDSFRNPITYLDDPGTGGRPRTCACGCGTPIAQPRTFAPGHDQRAVHERITRQWGSTLSFIAWFDQTFPDVA